MSDARYCPECGQQFNKNWSGIDSHWNRYHADIAPYQVARRAIRSYHHWKEGHLKDRYLQDYCERLEKKEAEDEEYERKLEAAERDAAESKSD
jgi:hypothetical protein